jgi:hypothetical protein
MRVQLRLGRASVWFSSRVLQHVDSFLALVRVRDLAHHVVGGSLDAAALPKRTAERWAAAVPITYSDTGRRAVEVEISPAEHDERSVEVVLFIVSKKSDQGPSGKQRIACVASTSLQLHESDLAAVDAAHEVVFKSQLADDLGSVEIALQRVDTTNLQPRGVDAGAFSVQWTSSEALERELAAKERVRQENVAKLLSRLVAVEANAHRMGVLRAEALRLVRRRRAAAVIQAAFRAMRRRRRERRRQQRRQQHEMEQQRKAVVRARVVERNQRRAQQLREQWAVEDWTPATATSTPPPELADWLERQRETTRTKLEATLARLAAERDEKLQSITMSTGDARQSCSSELLSDELILAIQRLHLRK